MQNIPCGGINALSPLHRDCSVIDPTCGPIGPDDRALIYFDGLHIYWPNDTTLSAYGDDFPENGLIDFYPPDGWLSLAADSEQSIGPGHLFAASFDDAYALDGAPARVLGCVVILQGSNMLSSAAPLPTQVQAKLAGGGFATITLTFVQAGGSYYDLDFLDPLQSSETITGLDLSGTRAANYRQFVTVADAGQHW